MEKPLVTVVIPTFNSADYLPATLDSVLAQSYSHLDVVVVDDGSTDNTGEVLSPYLDRIRYLRQDNWGGPSRPRNVAVEAAKGDLVAFFDSDDLMAPDKVVASVEAFAAHPGLGLVFSNFRGIDEKGDVCIADFLFRYRNFREGLLGGEGPVRILPAREAFSQLLRANFVGTSSVVCRKDVLDRVGPFDEDMLNADDIDMWRRIAYAGYDFGFVDLILHEYRKRGGGVTARGFKRYPALLRGLEKQLVLDLEPWEQNHIEDRIQTLEQEYGAALSRAGMHLEARRVFRRALARRPTIKGCLGLAKAVIRSCGR